MFASPQSEVGVFKSFRQSTKDVLRNVLLMIYGGFVFLLPRIMPHLMPTQTTIDVVQALGLLLLGQGFLNIIYIAFGIDSNRSLINKLDRQEAHIQVLEDKLNGQDTHIQALEDKLTTTNTLLQQLVDKANQPTTNALTTPTSLTNTPDITTKLDSPDQTALVSNGHISNKS
jgi:hypothetical protein